jgi:hypothetical protein
MTGRIRQDPPHGCVDGAESTDLVSPTAATASPTPRANVRWGYTPTSFPDSRLRRRKGGGASADSSGASRR